MDKIKRLYSLFIKLLKRVNLPGKSKINLFDFLNYFTKGLVDDSITQKASSISFNFFMALFPGIIFLFTLIPLIPIDGFQGTLMTMIKNILPQQTNQASIEIIQDIISRPRGGLLSFGFIFALFFSTNGVNAVINAFNSSIYVTETRSFLSQRVMAIYLVFILFFLLITSISLLLASKYVYYHISDIAIFQNYFIYLLFYVSKYIVVLALIYFAFSFMYYLAPSSKIRYKFFSQGALVATILSILSSQGFNYYINNFSKYNLLYGSIGTILIILLWIYFNSLILLIGYELNTSMKFTIDKK